MKKITLPALLSGCLLFTLSTLEGQPLTDLVDSPFQFVTTGENHLNFFVISRRKKGKLDLATRFNVFRAKWRSFFRPGHFVAIVANNMQEASAKIRYRLQKRFAHIGTVWFDSHGLYKKGYSLFQVGDDEINLASLKDTVLSREFSSLAPYADEESRFVIGSCYGGATYLRSSVDYRDTTRMNGDSLMISLGRLLQNGHIYASESWVMTKPGLFHRKPAVGGFPNRKLFRDVCYRPAWENVGQWNSFSIRENHFSPVNPVALDPRGNLVVRGKPFLEEKKVRDDIQKNLENLAPGLYH